LLFKRDSLTELLNDRTRAKIRSQLSLLFVAESIFFTCWTDAGLKHLVECTAAAAVTCSSSCSIAPLLILVCCFAMSPALTLFHKGKGGQLADPHPQIVQDHQFFFSRKFGEKCEPAAGLG